MLPDKNWEFDCEAELERKSTEAIDWLLSKKGVISDCSYVTALKVFDMTTRGLIDSDISFACDEEANIEIEADRFSHFIRGGKLAAIAIDSSNWEVRAFIDGKSVIKTLENQNEMMKVYDHLCTKLKNIGYREAFI